MYKMHTSIHVHVLLYAYITCTCTRSSTACAVELTSGQQTEVAVCGGEGSHKARQSVAELHVGVCQLSPTHALTALLLKTVCVCVCVGGGGIGRGIGRGILVSAASTLGGWR